MSLRQQHLFSYIKRLLRYASDPRNFLKIFYRPQRIVPFLREQLGTARGFLRDVKLDPLSDARLLGIEKASVRALATLAGTRSLSGPLQLQSIDAVFGPGTESDPDSVRLAELFRQYGSDKASSHDYYRVYAALLKSVTDKPLNLLEIGLGTNHIDMPSNMGGAGSPGASLRAFRDMYPLAAVRGADIDTRILFEEDRIKTYFTDQTRPEALADLKQQLDPMRFDLIIDDGLHNTQANLNTMNFALALLKPDGVFVVEDAGEEDLYYYRIAAALLQDRFRLHFLQTRSAWMCLFLPLGRPLNVSS